MLGRHRPKKSSYFDANPQWYKDAVIYELHVRAFFDSNNDGIGDFKGLIQKLDYLADLGVTALWLLPFYPSPGRDDGYDTADYTDIHSNYGTLRDFKEFLKQAHRRGLRVITELVLNHTSDQHQWFQKSRRAPKGDPWRDFYVWSDDPSLYKEVRIIFKDFETSNWTWDPVAKSYYWHRFYSHQPDLNFDNPNVKRQLLELVDYWFEMGVDGMRLDAVPYLYERDGTSCENLPETHQFLRELRQHIDRRFDDKMLLAEANQWPEDAVAYFGNGDECHMSFHFPLMPRLFMALRLEDRFSIIDILRQTPQIPDSCQWACFLRNHDELTLEMVTDEERDYMYNSYASDTRARINLGIRRRLLPLLGNDRRQVELLNALLFSLPGTPVLYYGDEIGMGDNIFLGDRNGVRTPFQWSPDRNAGFSKADPHQLYLPVVVGPEYHYATVNVETQENNQNSILWWMKNIIAYRRRFKSLNRGDLHFLHPENTKVLAFLRQSEGETMLIVANLSRKAQCVELDLAKFRDHRPLEAFGRVEFPAIGELPYFITLSPYGFYWFELRSPASGDRSRPMLLSSPAPLELAGHPLEALEGDETRRRLESDLPSYLQQMRWYSGKDRQIERLQIEEVWPLEISAGRANFALATVKINYQDGLPDRYLLSIGYAEGDHGARIKQDLPSAAMTGDLRRVGQETQGFYYDASVETEFYQELLYFILKRRRVSRGQTDLEAKAYCTFKKTWLKSPPAPNRRGFEQSNTSVLYGEEFFLKLYRRIDAGINPEVEIGRYLSTQESFAHTPKLLASLDLKGQGTTFNFGILSTQVANEGDAWKMTLNDLTTMAERALAERSEAELSELGPLPSLMDSMSLEPSVLIREEAAHYLQHAELIGKRLGELHLAIGVEDSTDAFAAEDFTPFYQRSLYQSMRNATDKTIAQLRNAVSNNHASVDIDLAKKVIEYEPRIMETFSDLKDVAITAKRIRIHGDLHLGQLLFTGKDFVILDFEGEPSRPIGERKLKRTPLKDVAGMLRSFDYALFQLKRQESLRPEDFAKVEPLLQHWRLWVQGTFLRSYRLTTDQAQMVPADPKQMAILLRSYLIEKVLYEIRYELDNRPDWINIPLRGILQLVDEGV